jgi:arylsulfatase A-like enzyme
LVAFQKPWYKERLSPSRLLDHPRLSPWLSLVGVALLVSGCGPEPPALDLVEAEEQLVEARAAGRERDWVLGQFGKHARLDDVTQRTIPASPPSRLVYDVSVPQHGTLSFSYAVDPEYHDRPAVEFAITIHDGDKDKTLWTDLLDPLSRPEHRRWANATIDLAPYAGDDVELILTTTGFDERPSEARRALWGNPALGSSAPHDAPLAIVYLVDTLRADHTTPYGYERDTTPRLAAFAEDAVVFEAAISHASWTKPSVASLLTSQLPGRHLAVQLRDPLDAGHVTLAEMLDAKQITTGAAIANSVIYLPGNQFDQGFHFFAGLHDDTGHASKSVDAADVVDTALGWLRSRLGLPSFLYLHTMDPHVPYLPPPPFDRRYEPSPREGHLGVDPRTDYNEPTDRDRLIAQYDGEIAYGDQEFGRFLDELKRLGLYDRALIVFVADHGEEFLDHGKWLHGRSVFDELIRVPLIVKFPEKRDAGRRVPNQVQLVDILPTVLSHFQLPIPPSPIIVGQPLQKVVAGGAPAPPALSEISHRGIVAHSIRSRRVKYIQSFSPEEQEFYFDLIADPGEQDNRIDENRERALQIKRTVEAAMVHDPFRRELRFVGAGRYVVKLRTPGWIDGVEPGGLEPRESYEIEGNGRKLALHLSPLPGKPRSIGFSVRPLGAPVYLEGTRDGRPLRPSDIWIGEPGSHPGVVPLRLPETESEDENGENVLAPPAAGGSGIHIWLSPSQARTLLEFDEQQRKQLEGLGYIGG